MNNQDIPAFPVCMNGNQTVNQGMSLRDFWAAHALAGFLANQQAALSVVKAASSPEDANRRFASTAFALADALLAERAKTPDQPPAAP